MLASWEVQCELDCTFFTCPLQMLCPAGEVYMLTSLRTCTISCLRWSIASMLLGHSIVTVSWRCAAAGPPAISQQPQLSMDPASASTVTCSWLWSNATAPAKSLTSILGWLVVLFRMHWLQWQRMLPSVSNHTCGSQQYRVWGPLDLGARPV